MKTGEFLKNMTEMWSPPFGTDAAAQATRLEQYTKVLSGYAPELLEKAFNKLVHSHEAKGWPSIPEITAHMKLSQGAHQGYQRTPPLIFKDLKIAAIKGNYAHSLVVFVGKKMRMPDRTEIKILESGPRTAKHAYEGLGKMQNRGMASELRKLYHTMMNNEQQQADEWKGALGI